MKVVGDTARDNRMPGVVSSCGSSADIGRGAKDIHELTFSYKLTLARDGK